LANGVLTGYLISASTKQEFPNLACQVAWVTKFCTVARNIFGSSLWWLLHVTLLVPRILRWCLYFWKECAPLIWSIYFLSFKNWFYSGTNSDTAWVC